jgi:hypothetical protein
VGAPRQQRLWAPPRLLAALPGAQLPCEGGLGRVPPGWRRGRHSAAPCGPAHPPASPGAGGPGRAGGGTGRARPGAQAPRAPPVGRAASGARGGDRGRGGPQGTAAAASAAGWHRPRAGGRGPAPPAPAGAPPVAPRGRTGEPPSSGRRRGRRRARGPAHRPGWGETPARGARGAAWRRPGQRPAAAPHPGAARAPDSGGHTHRCGGSASGGREGRARRTAPPGGRRAWPLGPPGPPPDASGGRARATAAGRCRRLCPWGRGAARGCRHPGGHGHHARGAAGTPRRPRAPCGGAASRGRGGTRTRMQHRPGRRHAAERRSLRLANRRCWSGLRGAVWRLCACVPPLSSGVGR